MTVLASSPFRLVGVLASAVLSIVGCNEVTAGPDTVQLALMARGFDEVTPLQGVEICQMDAANCVTTDGFGNAAIDLPANEKIAWTAAKEGYGSYLVGDVTDGAFVPSSVFSMATDEWLAQQFSRVRSDYPLRDDGAILVSLFPRFAGATITLVDATGKRFYIDEEGNSDLDLDATTSDGTAGFVDVGPGEFQIDIGGTAERCVPERAWPGNTNNRIEVPVRAGYITAATIICPPP